MTQPWHHINDEPHAECGGCGRFYPVLFGSCPFCYVQQFLEIEAEAGCCPVCGSEGYYLDKEKKE